MPIRPRSGKFRPHGCCSARTFLFGVGHGGLCTVAVAIWSQTLTKFSSLGQPLRIVTLGLTGAAPATFRCVGRENPVYAL